MSAIRRIEDGTTCNTTVLGEQVRLKALKRKMKAYRERTKEFDKDEIAGALASHDEINQLLDGIRYELEYRDKLIAKYEQRKDGGREFEDVYSPSQPYAA